MTIEQQDDMRYPIFVYGTLRPDCGNTWAWKGMATARYDGTARAVGHRLVSNGAFPYMIPAVTEQAVGTLIFPSAEHYDTVLANMDGLEGVPFHYTRELIAVLCDDPDDGAAIFAAWTYIPANVERMGLLPEVPGNDWHQRRSRNHPTMRGQA